MFHFKKKTFTLLLASFLLVGAGDVIFNKASSKVDAAMVTYNKISSLSDLSDGDKYLIVYENGDNSVAFNGSLATLDAESNGVEVSVVDNKIKVIESTDNFYFTIASGATEGKKTIKSASGKYIGITSYKNGLASSESVAYENTITFEKVGSNTAESAKILGFSRVNSDTGATEEMNLFYNSASNQQRFRYFTSTSNKIIQLYKRGEVTTEPSIRLDYGSTDPKKLLTGQTYEFPYITDDVTNPVVELSSTDFTISNDTANKKLVIDTSSLVSLSENKSGVVSYTVKDGSETKLTGEFDFTVLAMGFYLDKTSLSIPVGETKSATASNFVGFSQVNKSLVTITNTSETTASVTNSFASNKFNLSIEGKEVGTTIIKITASEASTLRTLTKEIEVSVTAAEPLVYLTNVTSTSDLVLGAKYVIANSDATKVMSVEQNANNRGTLDGTYVSSNGLKKTSDMQELILLPAAEGKYAFYDASKTKLLSSVGSSNYLRTDGDYGTTKAYASISFGSASETSPNLVPAVITFTTTGSSILRYNSGSKIFSCYAGTQEAVTLFKSPDAPISLGETWAADFNRIADCNNDRAMTGEKWAELVTNFNEQTIPEKMAASFMDKTLGSSAFQQAIHNYEHCVTSYAGLNNFLEGRAKTPSSRSSAYYMEDSHIISVVMIISLTSITIIGGALVLRKRKDAQ